MKIPLKTRRTRLNWASPYLPNPSARAGYDTRSIFKRSLTGLSSEFSFSWNNCLTKAEEPSLSYYLPIAGGRIIGFIPFPRVLELCEMQSVSSRIWTHVAVSMSYDDNHYTTGTSIKLSVTRKEFEVETLNLVLFGYVYGISTIVGYLMLNPVYTYIRYICFLKSFYRYIFKWTWAHSFVHS